MKGSKITKTDWLVIGTGGALIIGGLALQSVGLDFGTWISLGGLGIYALYSLWVVIHAIFDTK